MSSFHRPVRAGDHDFLVDGSSFVFRAYFQSIRQDQKYNYRSDRLPTGAVRLFCAKLLQFVRDGAAGALAGGELDVSSILERGTTLVVRLPATSAGQAVAR